MDELANGTTPFDVKDFENVLNKELNVFKEEKYDYVRDLKDAYSKSLKTTREERIFATLPDHVFWDIKTPQQKKPVLRQNRYNPARGREFDNFFDMRNSEEYQIKQNNRENLNDAVSIHTKY